MMKPCPFCGSDNVHLDTDGNMTWVICLSCDSRGKRYYNCRESSKKAIESWNMRVFKKPAPSEPV